jgi:type II secretory pathway pseudopilin PulG
MASARSSSSESGFALIEAVVSAAVLAIVALAVLSGIDAASSSSGREKARAVAATLAEQEQERLRSLDVNTLAAVNGKAVPVTVDGADYTVTSKATWITDDAGGTPACGNSSKNNEYLHITTTVTSALVGARTKPVVIDSLVAPSTKYSSTHGILGIKVVDRNGVGVVGASVTATSTSPSVSRSDTTDSEGCVRFKQLEVATYTITVSKGGYVGTDLSPTVTTTQKATPGTVTFKTVEYDVATTASVTVKTTPPATTPSASNQQPSKATKISLTNAKVTGLLKGYPNAAPSSPLNVGPLYPHKATAYSFFTGTCEYQSPDTDAYNATVNNPNYFGTYPGSLLMDPTKSQPQAVTVLQPPLNLRITTNSSGGTSFTTANLLVYAKPDNSTTGDACTESQVQLTFMTWPGGVWGTTPPAGAGKTSGYVSQTGATYDPGMPYGKYTICLRDTAPNPDQYRTFTYDNTKALGLTTTVVNPTGSWTTASCIG